MDPPLCGGLDAQAMRGRLATRLFGTDAGDVSIGRFQIVERIGAGGMGVVYLASDPKLGRRVALKLLHPKAVASEEDRLRLLREARALAKLSHPNVVQLYEVGEYKGSVFLAMEYVHGVPLSDWQSETDHTWRETLEPYLQAAKGLAAAHAAGLVHRDFKPANAIVGEDGRVRVADFGLARGPGLSSQESSDVGSSEASRSGVDSTITRPGSVVGTPAYMSPEQFTGDPVSASSDQFSYCVALWEALTGERPYSVTALRMGADAALPKEHGGAAYPRWLDALLRRGLALTPGDRFADMDALLAALQRGLRPRTAVRSAVAVAGLVVLALGAQLLMTREVGCANEPTLMDVWDAARRERAKAGVATTGDDGPVWWRIERGLDQYSAQWRTRVDALCTAEQGLAPLMGWRRCLERSKRQLNYSIGLLDSGD
ncbi:MAG: serine/threonine protein kinase, partial [Nannocystaceae bacterium]|nr:serine/threonine protein kinase [Nannocystaceae bacterium]